MTGLTNRSRLLYWLQLHRRPTLFQPLRTSFGVRIGCLTKDVIMTTQPMLLDLVNSRLTLDDRVADELGDDRAAASWLRARGADGTCDRDRRRPRRAGSARGVPPRRGTRRRARTLGRRPATTSRAHRQRSRVARGGITRARGRRTRRRGVGVAAGTARIPHPRLRGCATASTSSSTAVARTPADGTRWRPAATARKPVATTPARSRPDAAAGVARFA